MSGYAMPSEAEGLPVPGPELIARVAKGPDVSAFFWSGRESVRELRRTLALAGRSLESFESILDFGCGCGRMLLWMNEVGQGRALHGTDIDSEAVAWCDEHIPWARVVVNEAEPPLPYPDQTFDLVFNHSVFTHIDERRQDLWLTELQRVTRVGALVVLSVHGEAALPADAWELRSRLEREGIAFIDHSQPEGFPLPDWYQTTCHAPWYVFEHWGRWFEIRGYLPGAVLGAQDHVLLERVDAANLRDPLRARPSIARDGVADRRVAQALADARSTRIATRVAPSRFGIMGRIARSAVLRMMRPYTVHEDRFDDAVTASIAELTRATERHAEVLETLEQGVSGSRSSDSA